MGMLALGIILLVLGVIIGATNLLGLAELAGPFVWLGWLLIAVGIVLAILHFVMAPRRDVVVERERRTL